MELEKYIQQRLWEKFPDFVGMKFYNTLPSKSVKMPYVKLEEISTRQVLIAPEMFEMHINLSIVSDKKSNIEVIEKFYEMQKNMQKAEFFDLAEKLAGFTVGEPSFKQNKEGLWQGNFKIHLKIITNFGERIC